MKPAIALDPRRFGRALPRFGSRTEDSVPMMSDETRLFATTFAAGFLFVTVILI